MIELNSKTQQDFLNREWVQRLLEAGVDMSDAKYFLHKYSEEGSDYVLCYYEEDAIKEIEESNNKCRERIYNRIKKKNYKTLPTYTVSELLYKLHEWIYPTINGEEYSGGLKVSKDAPFYFAYYDLKNKEGKGNTEEFYAEAEYPIESLAMLLIQCHKRDIGIKRKDTGDISSK